MTESCRIALAESLWRALLATLAACILIVCVVPDSTSAFLTGGVIALVYSLLNILAAFQLKGEVAHGHAHGPEWVSALFLRQRPARMVLRDPFTPAGVVMLRFAEIGAATAIALLVATLVD
jgi:hypothetical protein